MDKWLKEISWQQLCEWIEYKDDYGEERNDLRMGAIASLLVNLNVDTRKIGGNTRPNRYISTWDDKRDYHLVYQYDIKSNSDDNNKLKTSNRLTKESWENIKTGFAKAFGRVKKES